jgi:hypothetical protein
MVAAMELWRDMQNNPDLPVVVIQVSPEELFGHQTSMGNIPWEQTG